METYVLYIDGEKRSELEATEDNHWRLHCMASSAIQRGASAAMCEKHVNGKHASVAFELYNRRDWY